MLEFYLAVEHGEDLLNQQIIPKNSSEHLALIVQRRLKKIKEKVTSEIDPAMLGEWLPLVQKMTRNEEVVEKKEEVSRFAQVGLRVEGKGKYDGRDLKGSSGTVRKIDQNMLGIEWDNAVGGSDLDGLCLDGHGLKMPFDQVRLFSDPQLGEFKVFDHYAIKEGAVVDKQLGHKIRFTNSYKGTMNEGGNRSVDFEIPAGTVALLSEHEEKKGYLIVKTEINLPGQGNRRNYAISLSDAEKNLQVSSLGQLEPQDLEKTVREEVLFTFFPRTVLEKEKSEEVIKALLMGHDIVLYGPPGSGKSSLAKDITDIFKQQAVMFKVQNCEVNCHPYSLFDPEFARNCPPCSSCMIAYDPSFRQTGFFKVPPASKVKVIAVKLGEGRGIERIDGKEDTRAATVAGYKLPDLTGGDLDPSDPKGFKYGKLGRANNGILIVDELDKLRSQAQSYFLSALQEDAYTPDELRFSIPAHSLIIGTANDTTRLSGPINDRMLFIEIPHIKDIDKAYQVTRRIFHQETQTVEAVEIEDTHKEQGKVLESIPAPCIIEKAVDAFFIRFREEYKASGASEITTSGRSKLDAIYAMRAHLMLDEIFYQDAPLIVDASYAAKGIEFSFNGRVTGQNSREILDRKQGLVDYIHKEFAKDLKAEENKFWCETYKHIAIASTRVPEIKANFCNEILKYEQDPASAVQVYHDLLLALKNPNVIGYQQVRIEHPFLDHLSREQPRFLEVTDNQLTSLVSYFTAARKNCDCPDPIEKTGLSQK